MSRIIILANNNLLIFFMGLTFPIFFINNMVLIQYSLCPRNALAMLDFLIKFIFTFHIHALELTFQRWAIRNLSEFIFCVELPIARPLCSS